MKKIFLLLFIAAIAAGCTQQQTPAPAPEPAPTPEPSPAPAPGPTPVPNPSVKEFTMVIGHTFYNPAKLTVDKGDNVIIYAVAAAGTAGHNHGITIDEYGINTAVTSEDANNPVKIQFIADKAGTFNIYCKTCWEGPFGKSHPDIRGTLEVQG